MRSAAPVIVVAAWSFIGVFRDLCEFLSQNGPVSFLWN